MFNCGNDYRSEKYFQHSYIHYWYDINMTNKEHVVQSIFISELLARTVKADYKSQRQLSCDLFIHPKTQAFSYQVQHGFLFTTVILMKIFYWIIKIKKVCYLWNVIKSEEVLFFTIIQFGIPYILSVCTLTVKPTVTHNVLSDSVHMSKFEVPISVLFGSR